MEDGQRFLAREGVGDVTEVDAVDDLLRRHVGQQLPQRLALHRGDQVPHRVDQRRRRQVDHALLRPHPAQLGFVREAAPETGHVGPDLVQRQLLHERREGPNGGDAELVSAPDREREPVSRHALAIGAQDDVGSGVVRILVHGIGAVLPLGRREADVEGLDARDRGGQAVHPREVRQRRLNLLTVS